MQATSKITLRFVTHIVILGGLLAFQFLPVFWGISFPMHYWLKQSIFYLLWVALFYNNLYFFVPRLLNNNRTFIFFLVMLGVLVLMVFINHKIDESFQIKERLTRHFHLKDSAIGKESDLISDSFVVIITLLIAGCSSVMGVTSKMQRDALLRKDLEGDNVRAELAFLKAQINPHFLFNTLNSIFVLTVGNEVAHNAVYNLSKMMRYVLYDTQENRTTLSQEIIFLKEYLSLMQLRLTENVKVEFIVQHDLVEATIAPMLFLPIVENAFKHGISGTEDSSIKFELKQESGEIIFIAENKIFENHKTSETESGIGLSNTRRRLELLYPAGYSFSALPSADGKLYNVTLILKSL